MEGFETFFHSLCSSSKGNAAYLGSRTSGILVDAGIGIRNFQKAMSLAGVPPESVKAILLTHEHTDHVKGLAPISTRFSIPVYGSRGTIEALYAKGLLTPQQEVHILRGPAEVVGFWVTPFSTPHDSAESVGFHVDTDTGHSVGFCTDLGHPSETVMQGLTGCDFVMLEANYDRTLLQTGRYPPFLKERIRSLRGHLSNDQCAQTMEKLIETGTTRFVLAHLSEENNRPEIARGHSIDYLAGHSMENGRDYLVDVLPRFTEGRRYDLE